MEQNQPALAFPHTWEATDGTTIIAKGMTLRDYFAAKIVQGLLSGFLADSQELDWEALAKNAYCQADEMMKAREA